MRFRLYAPSDEGCVRIVIQPTERAASRLVAATVMLDFELPAMNAFREIFPLCSPVGCNFHFRQCMWRCVQIRCLGPLCKGNSELSHQIRQLEALAFVPIDEVQSVFSLLKPFLDRRLDCVVAYFERTFVGYSDGQRVHSPLFGLTMWNLVGRVLAGLPPTNNLVEGWHNSLNRFVGMKHPPIGVVFENYCKFSIRHVLHDTLLTELLHMVDVVFRIKLFLISCAIWLVSTTIFRDSFICREWPISGNKSALMIFYI